MSTASNGKIAHAHTVGVGSRSTAATHPASAPGSVDKITVGGKSTTGDKTKKDGGKPKLTGPERRKELMIVIVAAAVVLGAGVGVYSYFRSSDEPKIDPIRKVGGGSKQWDYICSSAFDQEIFRRKRIMIEDVHEQKKKIEEAFLAGQLPEAKYKTLLSYFWIAKKWKEIDKYASKSPREQREYIAHLVDDELTPPLNKDHRLEAVKRSKPETKAIMERFPVEEKQKILAFDQMVDEAVKQQRKENQKIANANKQAQTRPTSRPADGPKPPTGNVPTPPKPAGTGATVTSPTPGK